MCESERHCRVKKRDKPSANSLFVDEATDDADEGTNRLRSEVALDEDDMDLAVADEETSDSS